MSIRTIGVALALLCTCAMSATHAAPPAEEAAPASDVPIGYSASPSAHPARVATELLASGDYVGLDAMFDDAWLRHPMREDGTGSLLPIMVALVSCARTCQLDDDVQYNHALQPLQSWEAKTHSVHARVALAWLSYNRAWALRGNEVAAKVTEPQWQGYREGIAVAQGRLDAAADVLVNYPPAALLRLQLTLERPDSSSTFPPLYAEVSKQFPGDLRILGTMMRFRSAGWGGSTAMVRDFIAATADSHPGADGDILYTRLHWQIEQPNSFVSGMIDWTRMKKGWLAMLARYPHPWNVANAVYHACLAEDFDFPATVRAAVGDEVYASTITDASRSSGCGRYLTWPDGSAQAVAVQAPVSLPKVVKAVPTTAQYVKIKRALLDSGIAFHCDAVEKVVHAAMVSMLTQANIETAGLKELDAFRADNFCESVAISIYDQLDNNNKPSYFDMPEQFFSSVAGRRISELLREERDAPSTQTASGPISLEVQELMMSMALSDAYLVVKLFGDVANLYVSDGGLYLRDTLAFTDLQTPEAREMMEMLSGRALSKLTDAEMREFKQFAESREGSEFLGQRSSRLLQVFEEDANALVAAVKARMP
jgi:hypothetical protein